MYIVITSMLKHTVYVPRDTNGDDWLYMWEENGEILCLNPNRQVSHYLTETASKRKVLAGSNFLAAFETFNCVGKTKITSDAKFRAAEEPKSSHG